jgi:hypothetical protein
MRPQQKMEPIDPMRVAWMKTRGCKRRPAIKFRLNLASNLVVE